MSDIEQRLSAAGAAWRAEQPPPRTPKAHRPAARRWLPAVAAVAVLALALGVSWLGTRAPRDPGPAGGSGSWQPMAAAPLSARLRPAVIGWGDRVVVLGGDPYSVPCPPNASCVRYLREAPRDAAVYDVPADRWERLPDAPLPLEVTSSAVLSDVLYLLLADSQVLSLDLIDRTWQLLPAPPVVSGYLQLVAAGDRLVAAYGEVGRADAPDLAYDPATGRWEPLPVAPLAPSFDRRMVWTGRSLVLLAAAAAPARQDERSGPPFVRAAVLEDGRWRVLPEQEVVIGGSTQWSWTGARVVGATTYEADGGGVNGFGRPYPSGGYLDPVSGQWTRLPPAPPGHERTAGLPYAAGGRFVANGEGLVLDTSRDRWIDLPGYEGQPDQDAGAAWAAGRLVVWGGAVGVRPAPDPGTGRPVATGAVWTPPT